MANQFIKATRVVRTMLGVLERELVLPNLVWRDAAGDFAGAKDETISIRVPAYANSRKRALRAAGPITVDELDETKVDVTLDYDVYKAVGVTDEEMTLDIESFSEQVTAPIMRAVARGIEDEVAALMTGATYATEIEINTANPYATLVDARAALNKGKVPQTMRGLVVGSDIESLILKSEGFQHADKAGDNSALREAVIGRVAGFTVVSSEAIEPDEGFAFHRTAYVLSSRAPLVPEGASWGANESFQGFAMRVLKDYDFLNVRDRVLANTYVGTNVVTDFGAQDINGRFTPAEDADDSGASDLLVRAVKITIGS